MFLYLYLCECAGNIYIYIYTSLVDQIVIQIYFLLKYIYISLLVSSYLVHFFVFCFYLLFSECFNLILESIIIISCSTIPNSCVVWTCISNKIQKGGFSCQVCEFYTFFIRCSLILSATINLFTYKIIRFAVDYRSCLSVKS